MNESQKRAAGEVVRRLRPTADMSPEAIRARLRYGDSPATDWPRSRPSPFSTPTAADVLAAVQHSTDLLAPTVPPPIGMTGADPPDPADDAESRTSGRPSASPKQPVRIGVSEVTDAAD